MCKLFLGSVSFPILGAEFSVAHLNLHFALDCVATDFAAVCGRSWPGFLLDNRLERNLVALTHTVGDNFRAGALIDRARQSRSLKFESKGNVRGFAVRVCGRYPFPSPGDVGGCRR